MKSLLALMLTSACLSALAANLPPCDKAVRFSAAWFADPEVDNAKLAAELTTLGTGADEIPPGGCAYARVMNHEQTHVRIYRDIGHQFRELDYPWGVSGGSAAILAYAKQELDRLMQAQTLFDSPGEYARNHSVCSGEITRLLKPTLAPIPSKQQPG